MKISNVAISLLFVLLITSVVGDLSRVFDYTLKLLDDTPNVQTLKLFFHVPKSSNFFSSENYNHLECSVAKLITISSSPHNHSYSSVGNQPRFTSFDTLNLIVIESSVATLPSTWFTNVIRDNSYFLFYAPHSSSYTLLRKPEVFRLKYRVVIGIAGGVPTEVIRLHSMCFYCSGGHPQAAEFPATEKFSEVFQDYTRDLNGTVLRVTSSKGNYRSMNYKELPNGTVTFAGGYSHEIFFCLRRKFKFNYKFFLSKGFGLKLPNGTFTGVIGNLQAGRADYAMETGFNFARFLVVEYMPPAVFESLTFLTKIPEQQTKYFIVFEPFSGTVWTALLLTGFVIAISYAGLISLSQLVDEDHALEFWKNFQGGIGFYLRPFLEQDIESKAWNHFTKLRLVAMGWLVAVIILATAYRAKLTTLKAYPLLEVTPSNFNELAASDFIIYLHDIGGVPQAIFQSNPTLRSVLARMRKEKSLLKCIGVTVKERAACVTLGDNGIFEGVKNYSNVDGKLMVHKAPTNLYPFLPGAPVLRKGQVFAVNFARTIRRIFDMGVVYKFQADEAAFEAKNGKQWARSRVHLEPWRQPEPQGPQPIKLEEVMAVLILHAFLCVCGLFVFLAEVGMKVYNRKYRGLTGLGKCEPTNELDSWQRLQQRGYIAELPEDPKNVKLRVTLTCLRAFLPIFTGTSSNKGER